MTASPARPLIGDKPDRIRCAIYTRKSTDEGLAREFNSLVAQREAAGAYIKSQRGNGWTELPDRYDDGGFSGGNVDRPALERLVADIEAGRIDRVVVYKLDRLSRSLLDFLTLQRQLEGFGVAIASVTEPVDTSTPMGRGFLNVLVSFAQMERELAAERTADKMAASRRKGKWVGGFPMFGYDVAPEGGRLVVNESEAMRVRQIYQLLLEHGSLLRVVGELNRRGWTTKTWKTKVGHTRHGKPFTKNTLHRFLTNMTYIGKVHYRGTIYDGEHEAIVDEETFNEVQQILQRNRLNGGAVGRTRYGSLLSGLLYCAGCGKSMAHAPTTRRGKTYRYYRCRTVVQHGRGACTTGSVPAPELERLVIDHIKALGRDPEVVLATLKEAQRQLAAQEPALKAEMDALRADLVRHRQEMKRLVALVASGDQVAAAVSDHITDLHETVGRQEARLREVQAEMDALAQATVDEADLRTALSQFHPVWDALFPPERMRVLHLLIERVDYNAVEGKVALTFRPTGIRSLAAEAAE